LKRVCITLGNIPRPLCELNSIMKRLDPSHSSIINIQDRLQYILSKYEQEAFQSFANQNTEYISLLKDKDSHLNELINAILLVKGIHLRFDFLDQSLLYYNPAVDRCLPITPMADAALISNAAQHFKLDSSDRDVSIILNPSAISSEKTKAFERVISKKILFSKTMMKHTKLDGNDPKLETFTVNHIAAIEMQNILPDNLPLTPTLLVPDNPLYPIADMILVDPIAQRVILIQITISHPSAKVPNSDNAYMALYDSNKWNQIIKNNYQNHQNPRKNYVEELLSLIGLDVAITINQNTKNLIMTDNQGVQQSPPFEYLIITPKGIDHNSAHLIHQFPWIRVLHSDFLAQFLSQELVTALLR